ncbi:hypothetical protein Tco_1320040 [Tanacetum coccineum]
MVLSLLSQMPPTSTPPTIKESLAKLADNIDKLELVVKRLAASTANLVSITSHILLPGPPHLTIQVHTYPQTLFVLTSIARSLNIVPNNKVPDARGGSTTSILKTKEPRRALGRRNQRILSLGQCRQEDRDALAAHLTILASSLAVRKAQGIQKITLKAKIVREGTGSLNHEERSPVSKMTISPTLGMCQD